MKSPLISVTLLLLAFTAVSVMGEEKGSILFEEKCAACHMKQRPSFEAMNTMIAPPIMGVMSHVKDAKTTKPEAVKFIVDYIFEPTPLKALCIKQSIERFGLMPSQKGNLTKEEATMIAGYLYENYGYSK